MSSALLTQAARAIHAAPHAGVDRGAKKMGSRPDGKAAREVQDSDVFGITLRLMESS